MIAWTLAACVHAGPTPSMGGRARTWDVVVVAATGDRQLEATYVLETEPLGRERWRIATTHTRGAWIEHGETSTFDSEAPTTRDPWPLTLEHIVASVPAEVEVKDGRPTALVDPDGWVDRARSALYGSTLPSEALPAGDRLIDPEGLLVDLDRTFPGRPPVGQWERGDRIAGLPVQRTEACTWQKPQWTCAGVATTTAPGAKLFEVSTTTTLVADRRGLVWMETGYSGTLVTLAPDGRDIVDRPIAGVRRVQRR